MRTCEQNIIQKVEQQHYHHHLQQQLLLVHVEQIMPVLLASSHEEGDTREH